MVDERIKKQLAQCIDEQEKKAQRNIEEHAYTGPGRSIYYDMLDAVEICRGEVSRISESEGNLTYVGKALRALKAARERYRYEAEDDGGYGVATFHMVIKDATALYESLGGREEELEILADDLKPQLLYMADDPWERCFRAFAMGDYVGCLVETQKIVFEKTASLRREVLLLMLISLQRTGQGKLAEESASDLMLPANYNLSEEQRCRFNFYAGERLLTDGREVAASAFFKACAASDAGCDERFLALAELHPANRAPIVSVYQLTLRAQRYQEAGDTVQALDLSIHAYELACRYLGEDDHVTRSLALRLARLRKGEG
jgi:hypothetical protein